MTHTSELIKANQMLLLIKAIKTKDDTEVTELLSKMDAESVNSKDEYGLSPLHHACDTNNSYAVTKLLSVLGIKVNAKDQDGYTALHYACLVDNTQAVEQLP